MENLQFMLIFIWRNNRLAIKYLKKSPYNYFISLFFKLYFSLPPKRYKRSAVDAHFILSLGLKVNNNKHRVRSIESRGGGEGLHIRYNISTETGFRGVSRKQTRPWWIRGRVGEWELRWRSYIEILLLCTVYIIPQHHTLYATHVELTHFSHSLGEVFTDR